MVLKTSAELYICCVAICILPLNVIVISYVFSMLCNLVTIIDYAFKLLNHLYYCIINERNKHVVDSAVCITLTSIHGDFRK